MITSDINFIFEKCKNQHIVLFKNVKTTQFCSSSGGVCGGGGGGSLIVLSPRTIFPNYLIFL